MIVRRAVKALDDRVGSSAFLKKALDKVFPDHWAFMLGEICVYGFIVLLLTGTYIAFFFNNSDHATIYRGPYVPLDGRSVPASYASVLYLSFEAPLGLLIRQMHHWAALIFVGAIVLHMSRIFFTGAFRKPRDLNWTFGVLLLLLGIAAGFTGYSLPGDLLSGVGLRIAYSVAESIPFVGTWLAFGFFGGPFPTHEMTQRLFITHVWLVPLLILGVMSAHLGLVWRQHHTQFARPGRTERNVVGSTLWPYYAMKSIGLFAATIGVVALLGGFFTIDPIWMYGPYDPWKVASPAQPDWYVAWLDGSLRLGPALALHLFGHTISPLFWSGVVLPGALFGGILAWPFLERIITGDRRAHNIVTMPYETPWRLGLGVAVITFATILGMAGSDDIQAKLLHVEVEKAMYAYRIVLIVAPPLLGLIAVAIGYDLRAPFETLAGKRQIRRASLTRNADGGFDIDQKKATPS